MKKKCFIITLFLTLLLILPIKVDAITGNVYCPDDDSPLKVRNNIESSGVKLAGATCGSSIEILDKNAGSNSLCSNWYKVKYNNIEGYSCGTYIKIVNTSNSDNIYMHSAYDNKISSDGYVMCFGDTTDISLKSTVGGTTVTGKAKCGDMVKINSIKENNGICKYYYNVTNQRNETGYMCSNFLNTTKLSSIAEAYYSKNSLDEYYDKLKKAGFSDSYLPYLAELHAHHPKWIFEAEKINLDFDEVVRNESEYDGRNLLEKAAYDVNYLSMGINGYNVLKDEFKQYDTEKGFYRASSEAVAFYLDPRNYLTDRYIFAFETLRYDKDIFVPSYINEMLSSQGFWNTLYSGSGKTVGDDIIASSKGRINPVHVASRIKQEVSGLTLNDPRLGAEFTISGKKYSHYYNFFNIQVWGTDKVLRGMQYAIDNGWNTPTKGISGAVDFIYNDYVALNQDTLYYEKFDVSTTNGNYDHQYMQNLGAVSQETDKSYSTYYNFGDYIDKEIVFTIPVYKNMPNYAVTAPVLGNPNNYLSDLKMNNVTINGFNYDTQNYDINVSSTTSRVNITASSANKKASVSGVGYTNLEYGKNNIDVLVTAQNGRTRTYKLNITRLQPSDKEEIVDINTILNNTGVKYNDNYIYGIGENTAVSGFIDNAKRVSNLVSVSIKDKNSNNKASGNFKTGDVITISNSKTNKSYNVVIYGDINGDGKINKDDCLAILRQINGYTTLSGAHKVAADPNKDGKINKDDCLAILRDLNGYAKLNR